MSGSIYYVFGPPGTGKTTYLAGQVAAAVKRHTPESIIIASFTRTAATTIAHRVQNLIPKEQVGTLHGFCYRLLGHPTIADTPEGIAAWNESQPSSLQLSGGKTSEDDFNSAMLGNAGGDQLMGLYQRYRATMTPQDTWPARVRHFASVWEDWKQQIGAMDFTDMIETCLEGHVELPPTVQVGFFDEVQDFTRLEAALIMRWAARLRFTVLAGDDDQCVYYFKGADPEAFARLSETGDINKTLSQSYRIPGLVHTAAHAWIKQLGNRRVIKEYSPRPELGKLEVLRTASWKSAGQIAQRLTELEPGKTGMVLASAGYMLAPIQSALRAAGIPYGNPYRPDRPELNPLTPGRGTSTGDRILSFLKPYDAAWNNPDIWDAFHLDSWLALVKTSEVLQRGALAQIKDRAQSSRRQDPLSIEELLGWFREDALNGALNGGTDWLRQHLLASMKKRAEFPLTIYDKSGAEALRMPPRVTLGTIHSVKGGEADTVFLAPDLSPAGMRGWVTAGLEHDSITRTFYVGMTRAKEELIILNAAGPGVNLEQAARATREATG